MATTIITGRQLSLTIGAKDYAAQASDVSMSLDNRREEYETIGGRVYKSIDQKGTLTVNMLADWGATSPASLCHALWDATKASPDTTLAFSFAANGTTFAGFVYPSYPDAGGGAADALMTTVVLTISGSPTRT